MTFNLMGIYDEILDYLEEALPGQEVVLQAIPDFKRVKRNVIGEIIPFYALQFGDLQQGRARNMASVRGDDYILPIYIQCISPEPRTTLGLHANLMDVFLGKRFPYTANARKFSGGGMYPITNTDNATEAYMMPASFSAIVQLLNVVE